MKQPGQLPTKRKRQPRPEASASSRPAGHNSTKRAPGPNDIGSWTPPAHLPPALLPDGLADEILRVAARNEQANPSLVESMQEDLDRIRRHCALNSPAATRSPEAMLAQYCGVLHRKIGDRVLRYCLAVQAGLAVRKHMGRLA